RRLDDDEGPRVLEREGEARARLAASLPELAGRLPSGAVLSELRDQLRRGADELRVARGLAAVRQNRGVLQPRARAVRSGQSPTHDGPGGDAVAVIDLRELDPRLGDERVHLR